MRLSRELFAIDDVDKCCVRFVWEEFSVEYEPMVVKTSVPARGKCRRRRRRIYERAPVRIRLIIIGAIGVGDGVTLSLRIWTSNKLFASWQSRSTFISKPSTWRDGKKQTFSQLHLLVSRFCIFVLLNSALIRSYQLISAFLRLYPVWEEEIIYGKTGNYCSITFLGYTSF